MSLSLAGEAEFYALQGHSNIYGYNSLTDAFMVNAEGKTWVTRTSLAMADFAVSPTNADVALPIARKASSVGLTAAYRLPRWRRRCCCPV